MPPLTQSDAICVLSPCIKLVLSHHKRYLFFDKDLSRAGFWEIDAASTTLVANSEYLASEAFSREFVCLTRFASCHRNLLRVLVMTSAVIQDTALHPLLITLSKSLPFLTYTASTERRHQQNLQSHMCFQFWLVANFGEAQKKLLVSFPSWMEIWKMYIKEIYSDSCEWKIIALCSVVTRLSVALLWYYFVNLNLTGNL